MRKVSVSLYDFREGRSSFFEEGIREQMNEKERGEGHKTFTDDKRVNTGTEVKMERFGERIGDFFGMIPVVHTVLVFCRKSGVE